MANGRKPEVLEWWETQPGPATEQDHRIFSLEEQYIPHAVAQRLAQGGGQWGPHATSPFTRVWTPSGSPMGGGGPTMGAGPMVQSPSWRPPSAEDDVNVALRRYLLSGAFQGIPENGLAEIAALARQVWQSRIWAGHQVASPAEAVDIASEALSDKYLGPAKTKVQQELPWQGPRVITPKPGQYQSKAASPYAPASAYPKDYRTGR